MSPVESARLLWGMLTGLFVAFLWVTWPVLIVLAGLLLPLLMPIILGIWFILAVLRALWELGTIMYRRATRDRPPHRTRRVHPARLGQARRAQPAGRHRRSDS